MDYAVAIPLEFVPIRVRQLRIPPSSRLFDWESQPREHTERPYFVGNSERAAKAMRLTVLRSVRRGSNSLRASCGL